MGTGDLTVTQVTDFVLKLQYVFFLNNGHFRNCDDTKRKLCMPTLTDFFFYYLFFYLFVIIIFSLKMSVAEVLLVCCICMRIIIITLFQEDTIYLA